MSIIQEALKKAVVKSKQDLSSEKDAVAEKSPHEEKLYVQNNFSNTAPASRIKFAPTIFLPAFLMVLVVFAAIYFFFTPLEKAADFSRRLSSHKVDGGSKPPSTPTVREHDSSLTGFIVNKGSNPNSAPAVKNAEPIRSFANISGPVETSTVEDAGVQAGVRETTIVNETPRFSLSGIMYLDDGPKAIVNGAVVNEGEVVSGATVTKINRNNVILKLNESEITLRLT